MSDLLNQFLATTKLKADSQLIERWEHSMRYYGDRDINPQAAHARRTATALNNACKQFQHLAPEQELAFTAAAIGMRKLADDLARLSVFARSYLAFCDKARQIQRNLEIEATAAKRWGEDLSAMEFERSVIEELQTKDGQIALGQWMHSRGHFSHIHESRVLAPFDNATNPELLSTRHGLAQMVEIAMTVRRDIFGKIARCSWQDYEDYLSYRKEVANTTRRLLNAAAHRDAI